MNMLSLKHLIELTAAGALLITACGRQQINEPVVVEKSMIRYNSTRLQHCR